MQIDEYGTLHCGLKPPISSDAGIVSEISKLRRFTIATPQHKQGDAGFVSNVAAAGKASIVSPYFWACVVYVVYASMMLAVDYCSTMYPDVSVDDGTGTGTFVTQPDDRCSFVGDSPINKIYMVAAVIHIINSLQYFFAWRSFGYPLNNVIVIPELLNMVEAALYLVSASKYVDVSLCADVTCDLALDVHKLELAAAVVELIASFGWAWSWWQSYIRVPGRGWTLDDPDLIGTIFTLVPSVLYLIYNIQITLDPSTYGSNYLYVQGDVLYFIGSLGYMLATLRDAGWGWLLPTAGGWEYELVSASSSSISTAGSAPAHAGGKAGSGSFTVSNAPDGAVAYASSDSVKLTIAGSSNNKHWHVHEIHGGSAHLVPQPVPVQAAAAGPKQL